MKLTPEGLIFLSGNPISDEHVIWPSEIPYFAVITLKVNNTGTYSCQLIHKLPVFFTDLK